MSSSFARKSTIAMAITKTSVFDCLYTPELDRLRRQAGSVPGEMAAAAHYCITELGTGKSPRMQRAVLRVLHALCVADGTSTEALCSRMGEVMKVRNRMKESEKYMLDVSIRRLASVWPNNNALVVLADHIGGPIIRFRPRPQALVEQEEATAAGVPATTTAPAHAAAAAAAAAPVASSGASTTLLLLVSSVLRDFNMVLTSWDDLSGLSASEPASVAVTEVFESHEPTAEEWEFGAQILEILSPE